ncbi:hypothetical protein [Demequina aurantiaca]|uniref:hypothetical protein n=1 Tax=Demequina aurantiaca TaxID=676200 RepID=UPI003D327A58
MTERSVWITAFVLPGVAIAYLAIVLPRVAATSAGDVSWVAPMLWCMGAIILGVIVATVASGIGSEVLAEVRGTESDLGDDDIRDKEIGRFGDARSYSLGGVLSISTLVLAMVDAEPFWIATSLFLSGIIAGTYGSIVKIRAYRGGF